MCDNSRNIHPCEEAPDTIHLYIRVFHSYFELYNSWLDIFILFLDKTNNFLKHMLRISPGSPPETQTQCAGICFTPELPPKHFKVWNNVFFLPTHSHPQLQKSEFVSFLSCFSALPLSESLNIWCPVLFSLQLQAQITITLIVNIMVTTFTEHITCSIK